MINNESLVSAVARILATEGEHETQMTGALSAIGNALGLSRAYVIVYGPDGSISEHAHEWRSHGIPSAIDTVKAHSPAIAAELSALLQSGELVCVDDVETLTPGLRSMLAESGVKSLAISALRQDGKVAGIVCFDDCACIRRWADDERAVLLAVVRMINPAFERTTLEGRLMTSQQNYKTFFNTVDDIIIIGDLSGNVIYANDGTCAKLGYSRDELIGKPILFLHPEDKREEATAILGEMFRGERSSCPLELKTKEGARIPVETRVWFGDWDGKRSLFGVSKDLSAEQAALQKFERLFRNNPAAMAISRRDDRVFLDVNEAFLRIFGYERDEVIGRSSRDLSLFVSDDKWLAARDELLNGGSIRARELALRKKDGTVIYGLFSGDEIQSQGDRYFLTVMIDITEQKSLQRELEGERKRLANIIWGTGLGTWEWNVQTGETIFNDEWASIVGYELSELTPISIDTWARLAHPDDLAESERLLTEHFQGKADFYDHEARMRHKDGRWVWVHDRGRVIERDALGNPLWMYGTHMDITRQKEMQERIQDLAVRDPLTGVYNRRYFFSHLEAAIGEAARGKSAFSLAIMDLDHFKAINDTWGHLAGDAVLRGFTAIVSSMVRSYDIVGRFGGEEFIILANGTRKDELLTMLERVMDRVRGTAFAHEGRDIRCTFSAGIADSVEFDPDGLTIEGMLALVDTRLYGAKSAGRDRCSSK